MFFLQFINVYEIFLVGRLNLPSGKRDPLEYLREDNLRNSRRTGNIFLGRGPNGNREPVHNQSFFYVC